MRVVGSIPTGTTTVVFCVICCIMLCMKSTHHIGNIGELRVMLEAAKLGYIVSTPHGHDARYDLIIDVGTKLLRTQVKTVRSNGKVVMVQTSSVGKQLGKNTTKQYTASEIDLIAVVDLTTDKCAFLPISLVGDGMHCINLRLTLPANNQLTNIRWFDDYSSIEILT